MSVQGISSANTQWANLTPAMQQQLTQQLGANEQQTWQNQYNSQPQNMTGANAYSNPQFQKIAQAQEDIGQTNLTNQYNQQQQGAISNLANRFGGLNTSMYNDAMAQNNRNMALGQANLANQYTSQLGQLQGQQFNQAIQAQNAGANQQNLQNQQTLFNQQQQLYNNPYNTQGVNQVQLAQQQAQQQAQQNSSQYLSDNPYTNNPYGLQYFNYVSSNPYQ